MFLCIFHWHAYVVANLLPKDPPAEGVYVLVDEGAGAIIEAREVAMDLAAGCCALSA